MKIARFSQGGRPPRLRLVEGDSIVDVLADLPGLSADLRAWLAAGARSWAFLASLVPDAPRHALEAVALHAPVIPSKLMALGANYQAHLDEVAHLGLRPMPHQIWFNKQVSSLNDPFADALIPTISGKVNYEGELAVVIGRRARAVSVQDALSLVAGYTVCNDVSVRDVQMRTPTHTLGKSFDTHGPLGPWFVTADEIPDPLAHFSIDGRAVWGVEDGADLIELQVGVGLAGMLAMPPKRLLELAEAAPGGQRHARNQVEILCSAAGCGKILGIGMNYSDGLAEALAAGITLPAETIWFGRPSSTLCGPSDPVWFPPGCDDLDYEGERVIVIGKRCHRVGATEARAVIGGYVAGLIGPAYQDTAAEHIGAGPPCKGTWRQRTII